ncbi:MAG: DUF3299 domain-containing protein [Hyphomonadaceae bacterium]
MGRRDLLLGALVATMGVFLAAPPALAEDYRELDWNDLLPPGELENLAKQKVLAFRRAAPHGSLDDTGPMNAIQPGTFKTVEALDGQKVILKGFVVPLDFTAGKATTFLLVPYYGACIHAPPPPPNQTILVRSQHPVAMANLSSAMEAKGVLVVSTNTSEMGDSAYLLKLDSLGKVGS